MARSLPDGAEPAICYSGYRAGQSPDVGVHPSDAQVREDLLLLHRDWRHLRLYDCGEHAETVLRVIAQDGLDFTVMLGAYIAAEESNPRCPWGGVHTVERLAENRRDNRARIDKLIELTNRYPKLVSSVSAGNEATVDWTDHLVPVSSVIDYVRALRRGVSQPVTFCENYVPWQGKLKDLAAEVDFLSVHTYPVWEQKTVGEALAYTQENWQSVAALYPDKPVVITEAGWTTRSNGRGIPPGNAGEAQQAVYLRELSRWSREARVLTYVFEAFDEPWKGSPDPDEPEKHWGLFTVERSPKQALPARQSVTADPLVP